MALKKKRESAKCSDLKNATPHLVNIKRHKKFQLREQNIRKLNLQKIKMNK